MSPATLCQKHPADGSNGSNGSDAPSANRRRLQRGTSSCWEYKRRNISCDFLSGSNTTCACVSCQRRGSKCISQEFSDDSTPPPNGHYRQVGERVIQVEALVDQLLRQMDGRPTHVLQGGSKSSSPVEETEISSSPHSVEYRAHLPLPTLNPWPRCDAGAASKEIESLPSSAQFGSDQSSERCQGPRREPLPIQVSLMTLAPSESHSLSRCLHSIQPPPNLAALICATAMSLAFLFRCRGNHTARSSDPPPLRSSRIQPRCCRPRPT
jgi:hypothetical protein